MDIKLLLTEMLRMKGSDMHIRANGPIMVRVDGQLMQMGDKILSSQEATDIAQTFMTDVQKDIFFQYHEVDTAYTLEGQGRFRVNIFQQKGMASLVLRYIPAKIPLISELKLPPVVSQISDNQRGLVLVTGTTGSGKSTTLAAMIEQINTKRSAHIVTVEDPIEFVHTDKKSIVSQRELGIDTLGYPEALKHVVRQDPNVILIGELRDQETMSTAITAAQTGHLVLSTLHTLNAAQSINRIIDLYPLHQQNAIRSLLADTLKAVVSQRLLPHITGQGRVPAAEVLVVTPLIKKLIEENNLAEVVNQMKIGQFYGMQTFNQALVKLYQEGQIKLEDALYAATNPEELMMTIQGVQTGSGERTDFIDRNNSAGF